MMVTKIEESLEIKTQPETGKKRNKDQISIWSRKEEERKKWQFNR